MRRTPAGVIPRPVDAGNRSLGRTTRAARADQASRVTIPNRGDRHDRIRRRPPDRRSRRRRRCAAVRLRGRRAAPAGPGPRTAPSPTCTPGSCSTWRLDARRRRTRRGLLGLGPCQPLPRAGRHRAGDRLAGAAPARRVRRGRARHRPWSPARRRSGRSCSSRWACCSSSRRRAAGAGSAPRGPSGAGGSPSSSPAQVRCRAARRGRPVARPRPVRLLRRLGRRSASGCSAAGRRTASLRPSLTAGRSSRPVG